MRHTVGGEAQVPAEVPPSSASEWAVQANLLLLVTYFGVCLCASIRSLWRDEAPPVPGSGRVAPVGITTSMNQPIITIDAALRALASANTPDELLTLANQAAALQVYARRAKLGMVAQNRCAEIRLRAERKLGQLLATTARLHGRPKSVPGENTFPSLSDLGVPDRLPTDLAVRRGGPAGP